MAQVSWPPQSLWSCKVGHCSPAGWDPGGSPPHLALGTPGHEPELPVTVVLVFPFRSLAMSPCENRRKQRQSGSMDAHFLRDVVWLLSPDFLLALRGHEQLHQQPCTPAAHPPPRVSSVSERDAEAG